MGHRLWTGHPVVAWFEEGERWGLEIHGAYGHRLRHMVNKRGRASRRGGSYMDASCTEGCKKRRGRRALRRRDFIVFVFSIRLRHGGGEGRSFRLFTGSRRHGIQTALRGIISDFLSVLRSLCRPHWRQICIKVLQVEQLLLLAN